MKACQIERIAYIVVIMLIYVYKFMENKCYPEDNWHRRTANINNYLETNDCFFHNYHGRWYLPTWLLQYDDIRVLAGLLICLNNESLGKRIFILHHFDHLKKSRMSFKVSITVIEQFNSRCYLRLNSTATIICAFQLFWEEFLKGLSPPKIIFV